MRFHCQMLKHSFLISKPLAFVFLFTALTLNVFGRDVKKIPGSEDSCKVKLDKQTEKNYQTGIDYLKRSNYTLATQQMRKVLNAEPGCVDAYFALGIINVKKSNNNLDEAEKNFLKVIEICPSYDIYAWFYLGEISYGREDYDKTIRYFDEFLKDVDKIKKDEDYNRAIELIDYSKFITGLLKNPVPFEPKVVSGISTKDNEYLPILSPDNQLAFFTREIKLNPDKNSLTREVRSLEKFFFSHRDSVGVFAAGEEMPDPFNINNMKEELPSPPTTIPCIIPFVGLMQSGNI